MEPGGAPGIQARIAVHRRFQVAMPEELTRRLVGARLGIKDHLRGKWSKLVSCHLDPKMALDRALNQPRQGLLSFRFALAVIEHHARALLQHGLENAGLI